jgi:hypothetical protein
MKIFRRNRWRRVTTCPSEHVLFVLATLFALSLPKALPLEAQERQQEQQATPTAQEGRRMHVVREGDTLWDLANFYLSDPFLWPEIYRLNTMVVEDPHWIYPAEELLLPGPGEALPTETRVPGEEPVAERVPGVEVEGLPQEYQQAKSVFAARKEARQRTLTYHTVEAVPPISVTEMDFYGAGMLIPLRELGPRGQVIDPAVPVNLPVRFNETPLRFSRVYVSHPGGEPPEPGDRVLLTRVEREVRPFGHIVRPTGIATIAAVHEEVSTAIIVQVFDRIEIGNQVTLLEHFDMERGIFAEPVAVGPGAEVVETLDRQYVPSVNDQIFIDIGRDEGILVGDEFEIYMGGRRSPEGLRLPEEHVADGRVVRVMEETSTLRVISQKHPAIGIGLPVRLVRKMPS